MDLELLVVNMFVGHAQPYPPFAKGGELPGYEARIPQETGVLPLFQRGIEGDFRAAQLMHESIQNQKLSGTHLDTRHGQS